MSRVEAKICGVRTPEALDAAAAGGARYVGLVFYPPSPRAVEPELAAQLARRAPSGLRVVGLFVDPDDATLEAAVGRAPMDMIQLHGRESPARIAEIRRRFAMPVMKAVKIAGPEDLAEAEAMAEVADRLLFDAKPPQGVAALPGGNGLAFDWTVLAGRTWRRPWMLSGGLNPDNVAEAIAATGATAVDVSSGVEDRPGVKSVEKIRRFLQAAGATP